MLVLAFQLGGDGSAQLAPALLELGQAVAFQVAQGQGQHPLGDALDAAPLIPKIPPRPYLFRNRPAVVRSLHLL